VSGSLVEVNMSNAVRISVSCEGVRPGATALPDFLRLAGGYTSAHFFSGCTIVVYGDNFHTKLWSKSPWKLKIKRFT